LSLCQQHDSLVSNIELLPRSGLIKDVLSPVLVEAGFCVFHEPGQGDNNTIVVIDFDPESVCAHQSRGVKIVALVSKADSLKLGPEDIAPLSGVLTHDLSADTFVLALRLIDSGERVVAHDLGLERKSIAPPSNTKPPPGGARFTPRERKILSHLVEGHSNKMIAEHLGITEATVKVHLKSVLRKINVANRTQAAIWALSNPLDP
jgi:two-component system, NarL family, nitrate/nitrite response regulator NarL